MLKVLKCAHCGEMVEVVLEKGVTPQCCGEKMTELKANTTDGAVEKHVPVATVDGSTVSVKVGSAEHPMMEEHHIALIWLETDKGIHRANLEPTGKPEASFALADGEKPLAVYEFCNLHGLWKADL